MVLEFSDLSIGNDNSLVINLKFPTAITSEDQVESLFYGIFKIPDSTINVDSTFQNVKIIVTSQSDTSFSFEFTGKQQGTTASLTSATFKSELGVIYSFIFDKGDKVAYYYNIPIVWQSAE